MCSFMLWLLEFHFILFVIGVDDDWRWLSVNWIIDSRYSNSIITHEPSLPINSTLFTEVHCNSESVGYLVFDWVSLGIIAALFLYNASLIHRSVDLYFVISLMESFLLDVWILLYFAHDWSSWILPCCCHDYTKSEFISIT